MPSTVKLLKWLVYKEKTGAQGIEWAQVVIGCPWPVTLTKYQDGVVETPRSMHVRLSMNLRLCMLG